MLGAALALLLAAEEPTPLDAPVASESPPADTVDRDSALLLGVTLGASAVGVGLAIGSVLDRNGVGGRVTAISAGALGLGFATAGITAAIIAWVTGPKSDAGLGDRIIGGTLSTVFSSIYGFVAGIAGLAVGVVVSIFTTQTAGTPRLVTGVAGGTAMVATSLGYLIASW